MIEMRDFWNGRDLKYAGELTDDIRNNAAHTVRKVNQLLDLAEADGINCNQCASGWRPLAVNDVTQNAAKNSKHTIGLAVDVRDTAGREFASWCLSNLDQLERIGLWMEDPQWTPTWVHLQIVPPKSGRRVYIPSLKPPLVPPLPEQEK